MYKIISRLLRKKRTFENRAFWNIGLKSKRNKLRNWMFLTLSMSLHESQLLFCIFSINVEFVKFTWRKSTFTWYTQVRNRSGNKNPKHDNFTQKKKQQIHERGALVLLNDTSVYFSRSWLPIYVLSFTKKLSLSATRISKMIPFLLLSSSNLLLFIFGYPVWISQMTLFHISNFWSCHIFILFWKRAILVKNSKCLLKYIFCLFQEMA